MLNHETNSDSVKKGSTFMGTLQNKLKDINNFSNWPAKEQMVAVTAVGVIFGALLPFMLVALPVAAAGAAVALTLFFAVKAVEYGYKGLKWSAEKTVKGAKYTAGKIKAGAVYVKNKVEEGYESSLDSLKRGAHRVNKRTKEKVSDMAYSAADALYKASGKADYSDKIKRLTQDEIEKSDEIKNDMKEIFADKGNNTELVKGILSGISSKVDLKIAEEAKSGWMEHTSKWQVQKEFINNLNEKSLRSLLTQRSLPKGGYFIDSVFSEHYSEIKEVIKEYKENHLYSSVSNMFNTAEKKANRPSLKDLIRSLPSFPSLERKSPKQPDNSSSPVNSTDDSSAPKKVVPPKASDDRSSRNKVIIGEYLEEEEKKQQSHVTGNTTPDLGPKNFATIGRKPSGKKSTPVVPPKAPGSSTSGYDSKRSSPLSSGNSTPTWRQSSPSKEEFDRELAEKLEELKQQPPSTHMSEQKHTPVNLPSRKTTV